MQLFCIPGAPGSFSINHCVCDPGFYEAQPHVCLPCPAGSYCHSGKRFYCDYHDPLLTSVISTQDVNVPQNSKRSDCICEAGFFRTSTRDTCKSCPKNFYCPEIRMTLPNVVACLKNEYTLQDASSSRGQCICDAGHKLSADGDVMLCLPCQEGERCQFGEIQETSCHIQNRLPNQDHSACVCMEDFKKLKENVLHAHWPYKTEIGNDACQPCVKTHILSIQHIVKFVNFLQKPSLQCLCCDTPYDSNCMLCSDIFLNVQYVQHVHQTQKQRGRVPQILHNASARTDFREKTIDVFHVLPITMVLMKHAINVLQTAQAPSAVFQ